MRLFDQNRQERTFQVQHLKATASGGGNLLKKYFRIFSASSGSFGVFRVLISRFVQSLIQFLLDGFWQK
jgi:hypothetical protein